ncbi:Vat family streptogramin A O-acetyltransferase [Orbus sturtevantii]|uniref:Vat family streptogramin A O-acetyltransferase n=1 Tax=Orbus sturtevantii TaxID=3074109 RepID=UPI00370D9472
MPINPDELFPITGVNSICFIKNNIKNPNIIIGDYTYYSDNKNAENFESCVTHHYNFIGDKLIIGKFCAIAQGVEFIMNGANHYMKGFSTYPFSIFGDEWKTSAPTLEDLDLRGDTVIGNDVWIGQNVTILPGINIGDGAIVAANAVVSHNIPPYHIFAGNPAKCVKKRFTQETIDLLLKVKWWDWPIEKITKNLSVITQADIKSLIKLCDNAI